MAAEPLSHPQPRLALTAKIMSDGRRRAERSPHIAHHTVGRYRAVLVSSRAAADRLVRARNIGTLSAVRSYFVHTEGCKMNQIIWIVGAVVIVLAVLSFFGMR